MVSNKEKGEIVQYLRDLYCATNYTLEYLAECVKKRYGLEVDYRWVFKVVKNKIWVDPTYFPPVKYRKVSDEIKSLINDSNLSLTDLRKLLKDEFNCDISITRIRQLKRKFNSEIVLII